MTFPKAEAASSYQPDVSPSTPALRWRSAGPDVTILSIGTRFEEAAVMAGTYDDHGIRFQYPEDWEVEETEDGGPVMTIALNAPDGLAFALITLDDSRPAPAVVADQALEAMREEYPKLDAAPALETIGGHRAVGHDVEFISLDLTNACTIRCFRTGRRTVLIFGQWSDIEDEEITAVLAAVRHSFEETDADD
jgi:hypothetical protein